jgi:hypothetical protein
MTGSDKYDIRLTEFAVRAANSTSALSLVAGSDKLRFCDSSFISFTTASRLLERKYDLITEKCNIHGDINFKSREYGLHLREIESFFHQSPYVGSIKPICVKLRAVSSTLHKPGA